jgi:serine/threonine protein kinase/tetratricopeptide (TPR) repeat protein
VSDDGRRLTVAESLRKLRASRTDQPTRVIETIAHYRVIQPLGSGGMGSVYLAEDTRLQRLVAVKLLREDVASHEGHLTRLLQEARAASALNHQNIVTVHEIGEANGLPFMVTEFVEGRTLRELGPLSVRDALDIGIQTASALVAAHAAGVIHRDLKPANIMRRPDGVVKILDFGIAKRTPMASLDDAPTVSFPDIEASAIVGTVGYMSPEQVRGRTLDARSDVFSIGVVLYELLTGTRPFPGQTAGEVLGAILYRTPAPASTLSPEVPATLDAILQRALAKDVEARYRSMRELHDDLRRLGAEFDLDSRESHSVSSRTPLTRQPHAIAGRVTETAALWNGFISAQEGHGVVLSIAGEAGIGKSALVEDFLTRAQAEHTFMIARGSCSERLAGSEAYLPILEALDALVGGPSGDEVAQVMKTEASSWYVQVAPPQPDDPAFGMLTSQLRHSSAERLKRDMVAVLQRLSQQTPIVLFLEDLHWSDASTVDLLAYIGTRIQGLRVLVIVTYRPSELYRTHHPFLSVKLELQSRGACRESVLTTLGRHELNAYVTREFPGHDFPDAFLRLIHEKTEGYPLFFVDLCRYLRDRGVITRAADGWHLRDSVDQIAQHVPESVRSMIERKIGQLPEDDRRLLAAASVQGRTFHAAILARTQEKDEAAIEERLDAVARDYALIQRAGDEVLADGTVTAMYRFGHTLYQNAVYGALTPARRASLSRRTAEALESSSAATPGLAPALGVLFETAREFVKSAAYFATASVAASDVFAYRESIALARRALAALEHVQEGDARARVELNIQVALLRPLKALHGYAAPEVQDVTGRVRDLSQRLGTQRETFVALSGFTTAHMYSGELPAALAMTDQCRAIASDLGDPVLSAQSAWQKGHILSYMGRIIEAREEFESGLQVYDPVRHHAKLQLFSFGVGPLLSKGILARVLWMLGYPDQAKRRMVEGLAISRELGDRPTTALLLCSEGFLTTFMRDESRAAAVVVELETLNVEHQLVTPIAAMLRAWTLSHREKRADAPDLFRRAFEAYDRVSKINRTSFIYMNVTLLMNADMHDQAFETAGYGLEVVESTGERMLEAELWRLRGEAALAAGRSDADILAEQSFTRAIAVARQQSARSWELRATLSCARLLRKRGRARESQRILNGVLTWFTEGFDSRDYAEAKAYFGMVGDTHA